jgi:hypothetical protein
MSMAKKSNNEENLKKFQNYQKRHIIDDLAKEGLKLLAEEEEEEEEEEEKQNPQSCPGLPKAPTEDNKKRLETVLSETSKNPYIRAKAQLLKKMETRKREMLETMERIGDINNRIYDAFIKDIARMGDELSNKKQQIK